MKQALPLLFDPRQVVLHRFGDLAGLVVGRQDQRQPAVLELGPLQLVHRRAGLGPTRVSPEPLLTANPGARPVDRPRHLDDVRRWAQETTLPDGRRVIDQEWVQARLATPFARNRRFLQAEWDRISYISCPCLPQFGWK